jgi:hypothetical protein
MSDLYDRDFHAWSAEQAALLRAGDLSSADIAHIAEEIESMGLGERRELATRLTNLLLHLLKWNFQEARRGASWRMSILIARDSITDHLADNPSLKAILDQTMTRAYRDARRKASLETGITLEVFPAASPWSFTEAMQAGPQGAES